MGRRFLFAPIFSAALSILSSSASAAVISTTIETYTPGGITPGTLNTAAYKATTNSKVQDFPRDTGGGTNKFARGLSNNSFAASTILPIGRGGGVTLKFQSPVSALSDSKEFGIHTGTFLSTSGGFFYGNMRGAILVSDDGSDWRALDGSVVADPLTWVGTISNLNAPTMSYNWGTGKTSWDYCTGSGKPQSVLDTFALTDFETPMPNDSLFNGASGTDAQRLTLKNSTDPADYAAAFGNSAGGNWFDISATGLLQINYLRINNVDDPNYFAIRLDSVIANSAAVPEPGTIALVGVAACLLAVRRRRGPKRLVPTPVVAIALAALGLLHAGNAGAATLDDVKLWAGDPNGANRAALVIDWNDGKTKESLLWGYKWNGTATGEQMLRAIVTADPNLYISVSNTTQFGTALFGIGYDLTGGNDFATSPSLGFVNRVYTNTSPYNGNDGIVPANVADHYAGGWYEGYWSYWVRPDAAGTWGYSGVGMSTRALTDGAFDGWSFDDFAGGGGTPDEPVAAVPEPGTVCVLGVATLAFRLRRRRRAIPAALAPIAALALFASTGGTAHAAYVYDPNDFAVEVVSSTGFPANPAASQYYSSPTAVLGRPALKFQDVFGGDPTAFHRVKLIEPAYATGRAGERLITTFNTGQSVTVRMGRTVHNDPNNKYGIDLIVYGNSFFVAGGGSFVGDDTNLNITSVGGVFAENVRVSVSPDNVNWYTYATDAAHTGDGYYPTNSYRWDRASASWSNDELDPTRPVDPSLASTLDGKSAADVLDLYDGGAGGTGFDLAESPFSSINYVRFDGISGFSGGEIDAVAAARPVPEPGCGLIALAGAALLARRKRSR